MRQVPTPSQTPEARQAVADLHALFPEGTAHMAADYDGDLYLTFPVGHDEAVEVETYSTKTTTFFVMSHRSWDRTGGMSREVEVGETYLPFLLKAMVDCYLAHVAEQQSKMEASIGSLTEES